jgi:hypothetical protein
VGVLEDRLQEVVRQLVAVGDGADGVGDQGADPVEEAHGAVDAGVGAGGEGGGRPAAAARAAAVLARVVPVLDGGGARAVGQGDLRAGGVLGDGDDLADEGDLGERSGRARRGGVERGA